MDSNPTKIIPRQTFWPLCHHCNRPLLTLCSSGKSFCLEKFAHKSLQHFYLISFSVPNSGTKRRRRWNDVTNGSSDSGSSWRRTSDAESRQRRKITSNFHFWPPLTSRRTSSARPSASARTDWRPSWSRTMTRCAANSGKLKFIRSTSATPNAPRSLSRRGAASPIIDCNRQWRFRYLLYRSSHIVSVKLFYLNVYSGQQQTIANVIKSSQNDFNCDQFRKIWPN